MSIECLLITLPPISKEHENTSISFAIFSKLLLGIHGVPSYLLIVDTILVLFMVCADYRQNSISLVVFMQPSYVSSTYTTLWSCLWHVQIMDKIQSHSLIL